MSIEGSGDGGLRSITAGARDGGKRVSVAAETKPEVCKVSTDCASKGVSDEE